MTRLRPLAALAALLIAALPAHATPPAKPGVPAVQRPITDLAPIVVLTLGKTADWVEVTPGAIWVGTTGPFSVVKIDPRTNQVLGRAELPGEPCAGLAHGFGRLWVPLCGHDGAKNALAEVSLKDAHIHAILPIGPAASEGGIAVSRDGVWMVTDKAGTLARIDPRTGAVRQTVRLPAGSFNPIVADGLIWVTSIEGDRITAVDARTGLVLGETSTGPKPRFLTSGANSIWTLNQGDGSITRIDAKTRRVTATIAAGIPGHGGDIAFGDGKVWATVSDIPLSAIAPATNTVAHQWIGPGGDSLRVAFGAIWLTDYDKGTVSRIPLSAAITPSSPRLHP